MRAFFCGARKFSDIQKSAPNMSPAILASRLKQLEHAGIIERTKDNDKSVHYNLTPSGEALFPILDQMGNWAQDWLRRDIVGEKNLDPAVLFWELRQLTILQKRRPNNRRVARFVLSGVPQTKRSYWLVFDPNDTEVCMKDPGYEVDLTISAHIQTLVEIWLGHISLGAARDKGKISFDGSISEIKEFSVWFMLSHFSKAALEKSAKGL